MSLSHILRLWRKNLLVTLSIVVVMALAIGSCTAVFSFVNSILFRPLEYPQSHRLVRFHSVNLKQQGGKPSWSVSAPDFKDVQRMAGSFQACGFFIPTPYNLRISNREPQIVRGLRVSGEYLSLLGAKPQLGRIIAPADDIEGKNNVVILSHPLWQRLSNGDKAILGQTLLLGGKSVQVVGVLPKDFMLPMEGEFCVPAGLSKPELTEYRDRRNVYAVARLAHDVSIERAQSELATIGDTLEKQYPTSNSGQRIHLVTLYEETVGPVRSGLLILFGAVGLVLLLACANAANLLLAVAVGRQKEFAIRIALGASQWAVVRQCLAESIALGLVAGGFGLLGSLVLVKIFLAMAPATIPRLAEVSVSPLVVLFGAGLALATAMLFGLFPALQLARQRLAEALNEGGKGGSSGARRATARNFLCVSEIGISFVLLVAAGLLMKSFHKLNRVDPGFNPENLAAAEIALPWEKYSSPTNRAHFYKSIVDAIKLAPGNYSAGLVSMLPFDGRRLRVTFRADGDPVPEKGREPLARYNPVGGDYFKTMQIPLLKGRLWDERDTMETDRALIVNQAFVDRFLKGGEALNRRLFIEDHPQPYQIVGVVANVRQKNKAESGDPEIHFWYQQLNDPTMTLVVRGNSPGQMKEVGASIADALRGVDSMQAAGRVLFMDQLIAATTAESEFRSAIFNILALCGIVLASVGLYGIMSYLVSQRTQELGIRMALGALPSTVQRMILGQGLRMALGGIFIGAILSVWFNSYIRALLFDVKPYDVLIYFTLIVGFLAFAALASFLPARRATRINPISALRND